MTPPIVKKLIAEKASASRKEDTAKFIQSCEDLGDWFRNHFHHKETIGEYMELVDLRKVKIFLFTIFNSFRAQILTTMECPQKWRMQRCASTKTLDGQVSKFRVRTSYFTL